MPIPILTSLHARRCRACHHALDPVLDLGELPLSGFLSADDPPRPSYPLTLCACPRCRLVQLGHSAPRDLLFKEYWYRSGINELMKAELCDIVDQAVAFIGGLEADDFVLDIGANDGTLLHHYAEQHVPVRRIAYEPAFNLQDRLHPHTDFLICDYFPQSFDQLRGCEKRVKVITSIAMLYDVDDLAEFTEAIAELLDPGGVWVVQFQDLAQMLRATAFDNVCHEHLTYLSLGAVQRLVRAVGLTVLDAEERLINGGSLRVTIGWEKSKARPRVAQQLAREAGCDDWSSLERFAWRVQQRTQQIKTAVEARLARGQTVDLYGASTKANTLVPLCALNHTHLRQAWERTPEKWGRVTAGTRIPIVSETVGRQDPPDALLVGIWQFADHVLVREHEYLEAGGTLILPLPQVEVVSMTRAGVHHVHA
jgi:NDP-4-keto-2,6-dideoxyhexose 3-C-methyltransferase